MVDFLRSTRPHRDQHRRAENEDLADRLLTIVDPTSAASEAYRSLRTNLLYSFIDNPPKVIVMTSPGPREGKSTTCANLGMVLVQADKKVIMIDCDLRRPVLHKFFDIRNLKGLVDILAEESRLEEVLHEPVEGLQVVTVGPIPPNPAEIIGSRRFSEFLAGVREEFDYILIDAPPIGLVTDPAILAVQGDGVLLVIDAQNTRKGALRQSVRSLESVGANILGTVMNNVEHEKGNYSYYGYTYGQG